MSGQSPDADASYDALAAKVDAFFARVMTTHPGQMQCRRGCFACCHPHLHLLGYEWRRLRAAVLALDAEARTRIAARAAETHPAHCALLDDSGACSVWNARPMVCRSHGLPLRFGRDRSTCNLNFDGTLDSLPEADVLDQQQLSVLVGLIDRLSSDNLADPQTPRDAEGRVPLRAALSRLLSATPTSC